MSEPPPPGSGALPPSPDAQKGGMTAAVELHDVFKIYREQEIETVALRGVSLRVETGEFVAIVGRSGSGKSTLLGLMAGLTLPNAGQVALNGQDVARLSEVQRAELRRRYVGLVFQNNNLIPFLNVQENVELAMARLKKGGATSAKTRRANVLKLLERVGLAGRLTHRPGQLSGGEQQRVAIAVALANNPAVLLADEPTGELDSTGAAGIIELLHELNQERGMTIVLVTHNVELVAQAGRSLRMTDGLLTTFDPRQEQANLLLNRQIELTLGELNLPDSRLPNTQPLVLEATGLVKIFRGGVAALRGVNLAVHLGESLAVMGPSGCGKSTLLNLLGGLDQPTEGTIKLNEQVLPTQATDKLALLRRREIGFIFQSHNLIATLTAAENVALPLILDNVAAQQRRSRALALLEQVGLAKVADKLPDQLSGGQRQRVAIARSLVHNPKLVLADEPTGSLDSDSAAEIASLLTGLAHSHKLALVLVTHDSLVAARCDRVLHMLDGRASTDFPISTPVFRASPALPDAVVMPQNGSDITRHKPSQTLTSENDETQGFLKEAKHEPEGISDHE